MEDMTPLMWAAAVGNAARVEALLDEGAAVAQHRSSGRTAVVHADFEGYPDVAMTQGGLAAFTEQLLAAARGDEALAAMLGG